MPFDEMIAFGLATTWVQRDCVSFGNASGPGQQDPCGSMTTISIANDTLTLLTDTMASGSATTLARGGSVSSGNAPSQGQQHPSGSLTSFTTDSNLIPPVETTRYRKKGCSISLSRLEIAETVPLPEPRRRTWESQPSPLSTWQTLDSEPQGEERPGKRTRLRKWASGILRSVRRGHRGHAMEEEQARVT